MSTIGYSSWAADLKDIGAVYPFQGLEATLVIAAIAFWLIWHVIQLWQESREFKDDKTTFNAQNVSGTVDRY